MVELLNSDMANVHYTKALLQEAVKDATSLSDVARKLGRKPVGGTLTNIKKRCEKYEIDITHFLGQRYLKGRKARNRKRASDILILDENEFPTRAKTIQLKRALLEIGRREECEICGLVEWNGESLTLDIDHKNGNYWDNREHNLRFLCPNCHRQTKTWGSKNKRE